jgi:A/G-specific adenine glycosylase
MHSSGGTHHEVNRLDSSKLAWFRKYLGAWALENLRDFPWRRMTDPYAIFVAEFLLQRTVAATVAPVYNKYMALYPTLQELSEASLENLELLLEPLGLSFRASRMLASAKMVMEDFNGKIPDTESELLLLPGIGKYMARSILAHAFGQAAAILDTNVARILERFFGMQGERVKSRCKILWSAADEVAPKQNVSRWNLTLLDFGALVCTARKPRCHDCPLRKSCYYFCGGRHN